MIKKKTVPLNCDIIHMVKKLPDESAGKLLKHILMYANKEEPVSEDVLINVVFESIKQEIDIQEEKENLRIERNKINGSKGGRPKNPTKPKITDWLNEKPTVTQNNRLVNSRFKKPTIEEVTNYCIERGTKVDSQTFYDHYETNGWKRGNTPIKNWKACVRTWENKNKQTVQNGKGSYYKKPTVDEIAKQQVQDFAERLNSEVEREQD